jgi:Txe/YoeB family toxin of Txe-Axe toxin-antitoxin module
VEIDFLDKALADVDYWKSTGNKNVQARITRLLENRVKIISLRFHYS